jgi:hypothetical protein
MARFEAQIREDFPDLPDSEIQRRATELRRAHMLSLSAKSAAARSKKRTAPHANGTAQGSNRDITTTDHRPAA